MKRLPLYIAILSCVCVMALPHASAASKDWETRFFESNQAYSAGDFQKAIQGYGQLIRSGHGTGDIYYNLGNAYLKAHRLGKAIWAYERARVVMPRNADLNYNLAYARDQTLDAIPESRGLMHNVLFWLDYVSLPEIFWGFAILNLFFWTALLIRLFMKAEWLFYLIILLLPCWGIAGGSFAVKWYQMIHDDRAVIVAKEADVRAGPHPSDTLLFKLHEGATVHAERAEDGWRLIRLSNEKRGWVKGEALKAVR
ncbi:MAG: hypothetical protein U5R49_10835 [Deltaproteobacteria bacterium]|nr:hypothetical protein [Deltaproteobacteria bacterium]